MCKEILWMERVFKRDYRGEHEQYKVQGIHTEKKLTKTGLMVIPLEENKNQRQNEQTSQSPAAQLLTSELQDGE